jgi:hypothetical protein
MVLPVILQATPNYQVKTTGGSIKLQAPSNLKNPSLTYFIHYIIHSAIVRGHDQVPVGSSVLSCLKHFHLDRTQPFGKVVQTLPC